MVLLRPERAAFYGGGILEYQTCFPCEFRPLATVILLLSFPGFKMGSVIFECLVPRDICSSSSPEKPPVSREVTCAAIVRSISLTLRAMSPFSKSRQGESRMRGKESSIATVGGRGLGGESTHQPRIINQSIDFPEETMVSSSSTTSAVMVVMSFVSNNRSGSTR